MTGKRQDGGPDALDLFETLMLAGYDVRTAANSIRTTYSNELPVTPHMLATAEAAAQRIMAAIREYEATK